MWMTMPNVLSGGDFDLSWSIVDKEESYWGSF